MTYASSLSIIWKQMIRLNLIFPKHVLVEKRYFFNGTRMAQCFSFITMRMAGLARRLLDWLWMLLICMKLNKRLCRLTLWAKWAIAQGPALKGAPHLWRGYWKWKEKGKEKEKSKKEKRKNNRREGRKVKKNKIEKKYEGIMKERKTDKSKTKNCWLNWGSWGPRTLTVPRAPQQAEPA